MLQYLLNTPLFELGNVRKRLSSCRLKAGFNYFVVLAFHAFTSVNHMAQTERVPNTCIKSRNSSLSEKKAKEQLFIWFTCVAFTKILLPCMVFFFKTSFYGPQTNFYFFHDLPSVQYLTVLSGEKKDYNTPSMNFFPQSSICFLYKWNFLVYIILLFKYLLWSKYVLL
jgi:hypothetical protein